MDGRNLFVMFVYNTKARGIIMNSVVLEDFPLDRICTTADMEVVKEALVRVSTAAEVKLTEAGGGQAGGNPRQPEKVQNMAVMDWRWMDRPGTAKARGRKRDVRV